MATTLDLTHAPTLLPILSEGKPDARGWLVRRLTMAGMFGVLAILPVVMGQTWAKYLARGYIYVIVGLSVNMLIGYAGQVSLGHAAFFGVGAFTSALLVSKAHIPFGLGLAMATAVGGGSALILGLVALRLKGLYLALVTLAYGDITEQVIFGIPVVTGGGAGVQVGKPAGFQGPAAFAVLCLFFLCLAWYIDTRFTRSRAGRAVFTIRENEIAAASFGINVVGYKLMAFVLSGGMAGLAGGLFAHLTGSIAPGDFKFELSLTFVLMTAVGGLGSRGGIFIGSMFFAIFPIYAPTIGFLQGLGADKVVFGIILIGAMLLLLTLTMFPGGIGQQIKPVTDWLDGKPFSMKRDAHEISSGGAGVRP